MCTSPLCIIYTYTLFVHIYIVCVFVQKLIVYVTNTQHYHTTQTIYSYTSHTVCVTWQCVVVLTPAVKLLLKVTHWTSSIVEPETTTASLLQLLDESSVSGQAPTPARHWDRHIAYVTYYNYSYVYLYVVCVCVCVYVCVCCMCVCVVCYVCAWTWAWAVRK